MNTLKHSTEDKETLIKLVNNFRLQNKNKWYQIDVNYNGHN